MKHGAFILIAALAALGACTQSSRPMPVQNNAASSTGATGADVAAMDSERDIVLAVSNPLEPPSTHAGSSVVGYAPSPYYGAGQRAASTLTALKQRYELHEVTGWSIKALDLYCVVFTPPKGVDRDALLKELAKDDRVQLAQPLQDFSVYGDNAQGAHQYNDPYANLQRGFVETDAALAHNVSQGDRVHIAIVDTGVDTAHPDLLGRVHDAHNEVDDNTAAFNGDRHGTEVAGIIAAIGDNHQGIVGIAPKAVLTVYKACWYPSQPHAGARCNSFTLAKALAAVLDTDARIVNLSLGGPTDPLLDKLLAQLLNQGRIVVAALPPDGSTRGFPVSAPGVLVVRNSGASDPPGGILSAPGSDILTTQPGGGYDFSSGSSMAAAHVSGIAALLLALAPKLDANTVHDLLLKSSKLNGGTRQVDAAAAVATLRQSGKAAP